MLAAVVSVAGLPLKSVTHGSHIVDERIKTSMCGITPISQGFGQFSLWIENVQGTGEDAHPIILHEQVSGLGIIAVLDGLGASGSRKFTVDGHQVTGATNCC